MRGNVYGGLPVPGRHRSGANRAAVDNIAAVFGEEMVIAIGSILLSKGFLDQNGIHVEPSQLAIWAIPTAICAFVIHCTRLIFLERSLRRSVGNKGDEA